MTIDELINKRKDSNSNLSKNTAPVVNSTGASTGLKYSLAESIFKVNPNINDVFTPNKHYQDYGITQNRIDSNLDKIASERQSVISKGFNSILQTLVGEVGLGTVAGASDLAVGSYDLAGMLIKKAIGQPIDDSEKFHNSFSEYIEGLKESLKDNTPIFYDTSKDISNGALTEAGWWFSNFPSVASSISLLIPGLGVTKGLKVLSNLTKLNKAQRKLVAGIGKYGRNLSQSENAAARLAGNAIQPFGTASALAKTNEFLDYASMGLIQRTMENFQESRQEYQNVLNSSRETLSQMTDTQYAEFLEDNPQYKGKDKDYIANDIATKAADTTFKDDWINVTFDVLEMYGLGSAWKGLKNVAAKRSLKNYNKRAAQLFNTKDASNGEVLSEGVKTKKVIELEKKLETAKKANNTEEIEKITKQLDKAKLWNKAANAGSAALDILGGTRKMVFTQLNEGIEEAVNYAAQQEGDYVASQILGTDERKNLDQRVNMYLHSPQLWESAFWGLVGGVVFGSVAPHLQRAFNKNAIVQDEQRRAEIAGRQEIIANFQKDINDIKAGKNIYGVLPEEKSFIKKVDGKDVIDQDGVDAAINKRKRQLAYELSLNAANSGNLDLLKEYIKDNNVKQGLIEMGIASEGNIEATTNDLLETIDAAQKSYDFHFNHLYNLTSQLKGFEENPVSMNIIQMIASENARHDFAYGIYRNDNDELQKHIDKESIDPTTGTRLDDLAEQKKYESLMRSQIVGSQLAYYKAYLKQLEKSNTLDALVEIPAVKQKIETLEKIEDVNKDYVQYLSLQGNFDENGTYTLSPNLESMQFKGELTAKAAANGDDHIIKSFQEYETEGSTNKETNLLQQLNKNHKQIYDAIRSKVVNELMGTLELGDRIDTVKQLQQSTDMMNAHLESVTKDAGRQAYDRIINFAIKYGSETMSRAIMARVKKEDISWNLETSSMTEEDKEELREAISVLQLTTDGTSQGIYESILQNLAIASQIAVRRNPAAAQQGTEAKNKADDEAVEQAKAEKEKEVNSVKYQPSTGKLTKISNDKSFIDLSVTNNNDGTYTLTSSDKTTFNDSFYEETNGKSIDGSKNYNILEAPIIKIEDNGNITITKKGILEEILPTGGVNSQVTNNSTVTQTPQATPQPAPQTTSQNTPQSGVQNTPNPQQAPSSNPQDSSASNTDDNTTSPEEEAMMKKTSNAVSVITKVIVNHIKDDNFTRDELIAEIKQVLKDNGFDDNYVNSEDTNRFINTIMSSPAFVSRNPKLFSQASAIIETSYDLASIGFNFASSTSVANNIKQLYGKLIDNYIKLVHSKPINGKYYLNPEDLIRSVRFLCQDNRLASIIYDSLVWYLSQPDTQKTVVLTNKMPATKKEFLNVVNNDKTIDLITESSVNNGLRVDTKNFAKECNFNENTGNYEYGEYTFTPEEYNQAVNSLNAGTKLEYRQVTVNSITKVALIVPNIGKNGIPVGALSVPGIIKDSFTLPMGNVITDVRIQDGKVYSYLKNYLFQLIDAREENDSHSTSMDVAMREFRDILVEWDNISAYESVSPYDKEETKKEKTKRNKEREARRKELLDKYLNNEFYKKLEKDTIISKELFTPSAAEAGLSYLSNIWNYANKYLFVTNDFSIAARKEIQKESLENWFDLVYDNYNTSNKLYKYTNDYNVTVHGKSAPNPIILEYNPSKERNGYALPSQCFANGYSSSVHKLAAVWPEFGGMIISGMETRVESMFQRGNTFVMLPRPDGELTYISTNSNKVNDSELANTAKDMIAMIKSNVRTVLEQMSTSNNDNVPRLYTMFRSIFGSVDNKFKLFDGVYGSASFKLGGKLATAINISKNDQYIFTNGHLYRQITSANSTDNNRKIIESYDLSKSEELNKAINVINNLIDNLTFNQSVYYLYGDNNDFNNEFAAGKHVIDKNGNKKFTITISNFNSNFKHGIDFNAEFESYSDFLLSQNCVSCATKAEDGNNFKTPNEEISDFKLFIDVDVKTPTGQVQQVQSTIPVEEKPIKGGLEFANDIKHKIESNKVRHKGNSIFSAIFNRSKLNTLKSVKIVDLLPKNVIFVEDMNEELTADSDPRTMTGPIARHIDANSTTGEPSRIEVGNRFLAMMAIPVLREQAVRKLIHEQLHEILSVDDNRKHLDKLQEVFDEFKAAIEKSDDADRFKKYLYENYTDNQLRLEEFLVESLTSKELFDKLNSIDAQGYVIDEKSKDKSLFQKIADILRKVFGWIKRDNSLYAKEWVTFNEMFNENTTTEQKENTAPVVEYNTNVTSNNQTTDDAISNYNPLGNSFTSVSSEPTNDTSSNVGNDEELSDFLESEVNTPDSNNADDGSIKLEIPSSIYDYANTLPMEKRSNFLAQIERGEISLSCR